MAQVYWIESPADRRFAILARPRGGDWLRDEVRSWREQGIDVVVSLLTPEEDEELDLLDEAGECTLAGAEFISFPIPDRGVPDSRRQFGDVVSELTAGLAAGRTIGVHCRAGVGRSALLAAAVLVAGGLSPTEAFDRVRAARGAPVPDTPEQRAWIEAFANAHEATID